MAPDKFAVVVEARGRDLFRQGAFEPSEIGRFAGGDHDRDDAWDRQLVERHSAQHMAKGELGQSLSTAVLVGGSDSDRGRMAGYLTRLSSTGLANVTSGGGQVPAFVVS